MGGKLASWAVLFGHLVEHNTMLHIQVLFCLPSLCSADVISMTFYKILRSPHETTIYLD